MVIWKVVVKREPCWRAQNALLKTCQTQSPGSLGEGVLPHPCWNSSFPQGLMHSRPSMSGLIFYICLSAMPFILDRGLKCNWSEKNSLCLGKGPILENQAAVAVFSVVQSMAGHLCSGPHGHLTKCSFF